jgi:hypothetical protein
MGGLDIVDGAVGGPQPDAEKHPVMPTLARTAYHGDALYCEAAVPNILDLQNVAVHCTFHEVYSQHAAHAAFGVFHLHIEQQDIPEVAASRCMRDRHDPRRPVQSDDTPRMEYLKIRLS